jgi:hypothetical protein
MNSKLSAPVARLLGVSNMRASIAFYEALGFTRKFKDTGEVVAFFETGGHRPLSLGSARAGCHLAGAPATAGVSRDDAWCLDSEVRLILRPHVYELRNQKDTSKPIDLVWLWFRSPHDELAAVMMRTSEPPHWLELQQPGRSRCGAGFCRLQRRVTIEACAQDGLWRLFRIFCRSGQPSLGSGGRSRDWRGPRPENSPAGLSLRPE